MKNGSRSLKAAAEEYAGAEECGCDECGCGSQDCSCGCCCGDECGPGDGSCGCCDGAYGYGGFHKKCGPIIALSGIVIIVAGSGLVALPSYINIWTIGWLLLFLLGGSMASGMK